MYELPEESRRSRAKSLFTEYLQENTLFLKPVSIQITESEESKTNVSYTILQNSEPVTVQGTTGHGFVDAVFTSCLEQYSEKYEFLSGIKLLDFSAKPLFKMSHKSYQSDAKVDVTLTVNVNGKGASRFAHYSDSIILSGFSAVISVFEFYINCGLCYERLKFLIEEASSRYRSDLVSKYKYDISHLVELGPYV